MSDITKPADITAGGPSDIKITVVLRLTPELLLTVDEAATKRGISRNAYMVKALKRVTNAEPRSHDVTPRMKK